MARTFWMLSRIWSRRSSGRKLQELHSSARNRRSATSWLIQNSHARRHILGRSSNSIKRTFHVQKEPQSWKVQVFLHQTPRPRWIPRQMDHLITHCCEGLPPCTLPQRSCKLPLLKRTWTSRKSLTSKINGNETTGNQINEEQYTETVNTRTDIGCHGKATTSTISDTSNEWTHIQQVQYKSQAEDHRAMLILWRKSTTQR